MLIAKMLMLAALGAAPMQPAVPTAPQYDTAIASAIHADVGASIELPSGENLWIFGDATQVNGVSTVGAYGYPHSEFALQQPGQGSFSVQPGPYGFGWQQVPNWGNGDYFWASSAEVDAGTLYVYGQQIQGLGTVVQDAVASFSASTLAYQGVTLLAGSDSWGAPVAGSGGFWMPGTHNVTCTAGEDCKVGDLAWVPSGDEANETAWTITDGVFPASLNAGTAISTVSAAGGGYDAFTKAGDEYGTNSVEEMTASSMTGPWNVTQTWSAPVPSGALSYSVQVHCNEGGLETGQRLLTYAVNGPTQYSLDFLYVQE